MTRSKDTKDNVIKQILRLIVYILFGLVITIAGTIFLVGLIMAQYML